MLTVLLVSLAVACAGGNETRQRPINEGSTDVAPGPSVSSVILATGTFSIPAANSSGDPGFHAPVVLSAAIPSDIGPTAGHRVLLTLRDSGRPVQTCNRQHPLSGCATVDWSDGPSRPNVPPGGVFDNHLAIPVGDAQITLFLRESGQLAAEPESFDPG